MADALPLVVYASALDVHGSFAFVSAQAERWLGYPAAEWSRNPRFWFEKIHPADRLRVLREAERARRLGELRVEYRLQDRAGRWQTLRDEARLVEGRGGMPPYFIGSWTDLTPMRRCEDELAVARRESAQAREHVARLLRSATHGLRTPTRQIVSLSGLAARKAGGVEGLPALLEAIAAAGRGLDGRLEMLAGYAEAVLSPQRRVPVKADDAFAAALEDLAPVVKAAEAVVSCDPLPLVAADPRHLRQVFVRLLDNALRHGAEKPRVHVWAKPLGADWIFSVRDHGPGLSPRLLTRLFAPFEASEERGEELGERLGLTICRELVERMGGRLWAESEPGVGSTFSFSLTVPQEAR